MRRRTPAKSADLRSQCVVTLDIVATLAEAETEVRRLIQPHLPPLEKQAQPDSGPEVMEPTLQRNEV